MRRTEIKTKLLVVREIVPMSNKEIQRNKKYQIGNEYLSYLTLC
jgi:hypothetical protein